MLMILPSTLTMIKPLICGKQRKLASDLEFDLKDTVDWAKKLLVDFSAGKTQLVSFDWSNTGVIDVKIGGSFL